MTYPSLRDLFQSSVQQFSESTFFVDLDGSTLSYKYLNCLVNRYLYVLSTFNGEEKQSICYTLDINIKTIPLLIALFISGHEVTPLYPETTPAVASHITTECKAQLYIYDDTYNMRFSVTDLSIASEYIIRFGDILARANDIDTDYVHSFAISLAPSDVAGYIFSSGSTGFPKGIITTHENISLGAHLVSQYTSLTCDDHILTPLRPNFDYGLNQIWQSLYVGCKLSAISMKNAFLFPRYLESLKPTCLPLMPAIIDILMSPIISKHLTCNLTSNIRFVCSSGGRLSSKRLDWLEKIFKSAWICPMYGLTEAFRSTYVPAEMYHQKRESIGIPIPSCSVVIVDENDDVLASGQIGELVHLGGCVSPGYLNNTEATAKRFRPLKSLPAHRCVRSGDLAFKDADGFLYFVGRNDEMMKVSGIRVSPTEVESVLLTCQGILSVVVFGESSTTCDDVTIVCCAITEPQFEAETLKEFLVSNVPLHMRPHLLSSFDVFPTTGNGGKIDRTQVKATYRSRPCVILTAS